MDKYIGIDLGTTNSTISVASIGMDGSIKPETLDIKQTNKTNNNFTYEKFLPSFFYEDQNENCYVGEYSKRMANIVPSRVAKEVKREIGTDNTFTVGDKEYRPETISSYYLKTLKNQAENYYGEEVTGAVITVPANFNFQQDEATRKAAEIAGFNRDEVYTIPEPTAALLDYVNHERGKAQNSRRLDLSEGEKNVLVFDLGGGTCDVSILRVFEKENSELMLRELSISQYTELGGVDFDQIVANNYLFAKLLKEKGINSPNQLKENFEMKELHNLKNLLYSFAEKARKRFSIDIGTAIRNKGVDYFEDREQFDDLTYNQFIEGTNLPDELKHTFEIKKKEYDEVIKPLLYESASSDHKNIEYPILNALKQANGGAGMEADDIDAVFLVGGMTNYQTIQERLYDIFGVKPLKSINPARSVSRGAAVYHHHFDKVNIDSYSDESVDEELPFVPIVPENIFIELEDGDAEVLLDKGTEAPYSRVITESFKVGGVEGDKVNAIELKLTLGPSKNSINLRELKSVILDFDRPVEVGTRVTMKVEFNIDREVKIKAWLTKDESQRVDVKIGKHEFSKEEIEEIRASYKNINQLMR
ncbi:MAG: Hsp70 family protein [Bacillota bacterium]